MPLSTNERGFFDESNEIPVGRLLTSLGRAVCTVVVVPRHTENINISMKAMRLAEPLPLQPSMEVIQQEVQNVLTKKASLENTTTVSGRKLVQLAATLIQFTDHVPELNQQTRTPYRHIEAYYEAIVDKAQTSGVPVTYSEQLDISLEQNAGNLPEALWQLFLASRFYARRRDASALVDVPSLTTDEKLEQMIAWQHSLAACVPYTDEGYQDAAGDTYYTWTHALAKVSYAALPESPNRLTITAERVFEVGTNIMQAYVNRLYPEGGGATARDHQQAAAYGNAIGRSCVDSLRAMDA